MNRIVIIFRPSAPIIAGFEELSAHGFKKLEKASRGKHLHKAKSIYVAQNRKADMEFITTTIGGQQL